MVEYSNLENFNDVQIILTCRSGQSDLAVLNKIAKVIMTSLQSIDAAEIELTEKQIRSVSTPGKVLNFVTLYLNL